MENEVRERFVYSSFHIPFFAVWDVKRTNRVWTCGCGCGKVAGRRAGFVFKTLLSNRELKKIGVISSSPRSII